ncbi:MAG TPA: hypothetical protein VGU74_13125 [Gemmatimonadales bacterium]|nr:hypothetical protein [Gemmatimonadales bacterium]
MNDLLVRVRRTPDRLLHPLRRRKAVTALRARPRPTMLLVVCHGNICRSPLAAELLSRAVAPLGITVRSAGLIGFNRPAPAEALAAAEGHRVSLSDHRSALITAQLARGADLIIVMDPTQRRYICERFGRRRADVVLLGDFDPAPVQTRTIRDPVDQRREVFDDVYARIARCVREFAATLATARR